MRPRGRRGWLVPLPFRAVVSLMPGIWAGWRMGFVFYGGIGGLGVLEFAFPLRSEHGWRLFF